MNNFRKLLIMNYKDGQRDRLAEFVKYLGISPRKFCINCGLSETWYYAMRKGIGTKALNQIIETYPLLNQQWLLTGRGEMTEKEYMPDVPNTKQNNNKCITLGVYSLKNNGPFIEETLKKVPLPEAQEGDICITVTDDAMSPKYCPSSLIHIREIKDWREYLGYGYDFVFLLQDGRRVFRRAEKAENEKSILSCSYNQKYNDEHLPKNLINKVYRVIACLSFY